MTDTSNTNSMAELIAQAWRERRAGRHDVARQCLTEAVAMGRAAAASGDEVRRVLVDALGKLGHVEMDIQQWDKARTLYEEAVLIARDLDDALALAHCVRHLGDVHRHAGQLHEAYTCYQEAVGIYRSGGRAGTLDVANALRPFAIVTEQVGDRSAAAALWREARELYAAANVEAGEAECEDRLRELMT